MEPIRLTELPSVLRDAGYSKLPPYRTIYAAAVNATIPALTINRIWHAELADIDTIANAFGLKRDGNLMNRSARTAAPAHI